MRLATAMIFERGVSAMLQKQSELSKTELQLATGRRVLTPEDDPAAAARILDLTREIETVTQHQRNIELKAGAPGSPIDSRVPEAVACALRAHVAAGRVQNRDRQGGGTLVISSFACASRMI